MAANGANPSSGDLPPLEEPELAAADEEEDPEEVEEPAAAQPGEEEEKPAASAEAELEDQQQQEEKTAAAARWAGWPGASVFRLLVPAVRVGSIIGKKGESIKRLCEETRARIRVLDAALGATHQIVLISAKEEAEVEVSPAMDATLRIFKQINEMPENNGDGTSTTSATEVCSIRLLVPSSQAIHIIGRQGVTVKSIQESTGATIRILNRDELSSYATTDERIVEIHGASIKVLDALTSVVGLLRKFLVDHGVLPLFEKRVTPLPQGSSQQARSANEYPPPVKQDPLYSDRQSPADPKSSRLILYGRDPSVSGPYSSPFAHSADALIMQVSQTMHIPLPYAEEIIGVGGGNIAYIRRTSGAVITLQESKDVPNKIVVEIKGSPGQVQAAQQLIQEFLRGNPGPGRNSYSNVDSGSRLPYFSYSDPAGSTYSSSYPREPAYDNYGSSYYGGYRGYGR